MKLTECQNEGLKKLNKSNNIFLTGPAGSGKTLLLKRYMRDKNHQKNPIVASTGAAAILIGGRTFHSFFGLGIMKDGYEKTVKRASTNDWIISRLGKVDSIVIDEISMLSGTVLKAAEEITRKARFRKEPWGGVRVIVVGDFAQLPPVKQYEQDRDWVFRNPVWQQSSFTPVMLKKVIRTADASFIHILHQIRKGIVDDEVTDFLDSRTMKVPDNFDGTRLYPRRSAVERYNLKKLAEIDNKEVAISTTYKGKDKFIEMLKKQAPIPEIIRLKKGALVMIRSNDPDRRYVNGSLGTIKEVTPESICVKLHAGFDIEIEQKSFSFLNSEGKEVASATNYPLNLAWAVTIHKSQGATIDKVYVDLKYLWEPGQAYVALSRVKSSEGLFIADWTPSSIRADPAVLEFYDGL